MKLRWHLMYYRNKFTIFGSSRMVADVNGRPKGIVWYTVCTGLGNFRLFPVGYVK